MSPVAPGEIRARCPGSRRRTAARRGRAGRVARAGRAARDHALEPPVVLRVFPGEHELRVDPGDLVRRARRAGDELADVPGRDRDRGGDDGLAAPDGRARRGLDRRHPGHGEHRDAGRADLRARAGVRAGAGRARAAGGRAAARGVRVGAGAQLDREGDAARGLRQGAPAARRHRRAYAMRADALREAIGRRAEGLRPCAIVATAGTTNTTAFDPIAAIAEVARPRGIWLHVDAAMAGTAMVLPECRAAWEGVEQADSLVWNPHKWMGVGFDLSRYYCRDPQHLIRVMGTNPSDLRTAQDGGVSISATGTFSSGGGSARSSCGSICSTSGSRGCARGCGATSRTRAGSASRWRRRRGGSVAPVALQTVCLRHVPPASAMRRCPAQPGDRAADQRGRRAYLTPSVLEGGQILRVSSAPRGRSAGTSRRCGGAAGRRERGSGAQSSLSARRQRQPSHGIVFVGVRKWHRLRPDRVASDATRK